MNSTSWWRMSGSFCYMQLQSVQHACIPLAPTVSCFGCWSWDLIISIKTDPCASPSLLFGLVSSFLSAEVICPVCREANRAPLRDENRCLGTQLAPTRGQRCVGYPRNPLWLGNVGEKLCQLAWHGRIQLLWVATGILLNARFEWTVLHLEVRRLKVIVLENSNFCCHSEQQLAMPLPGLMCTI